MGRIIHNTVEACTLLGTSSHIPSAKVFWSRWFSGLPFRWDMLTVSSLEGQIISLPRSHHAVVQSVCFKLTSFSFYQNVLRPRWLTGPATPRREISLKCRMSLDIQGCGSRGPLLLSQPYGWKMIHVLLTFSGDFCSFSGVYIVI